MRGRKKMVPIVLVAIVLVVIAAAVLGFILRRDQGAGSGTEAMYKVGEVIDLGGVQFSVIRSYESRGTDSERPQLYSVFTIARVSLTNKGNQSVTVKPEDFALLADGKETPLKALSYVFETLTETNLQPGATVEGAISWETPARIKTKHLIYTGPTGAKATVDLLAQAE